MELKTETNHMLDELFTVDIDNLTEFVEAENNPGIAAAAGDMQMNKSIGLAAGIIVMVLFTYVISVFVIHQIQRESSVIDAIFPYAISNVACGMDLHIPYYMYALIYIGIILIYFMVNGMLTAKLKKISPAEVLKNRE